VASRQQTESQQQTPDLNELLSELANKIERLKTLYEQYFMGIEKVEPQVVRKEVTRVMLGLQQQYIRNTALRFKFNTMLQKWNIYVTYWNRVLREIENGTYTRHLARVKRKAEAEGRDLPSEMPFKRIRPPTGELELPRGLDSETGSGPTQGSPDTSDDELEQIWDRLTGLDPKRSPPPTPPPGSLTAAMFTASRPAPPDAGKPGAAAARPGLSLDAPTPVVLPVAAPAPPRPTTAPPTTPGAAARPPLPPSRATPAPSTSSTSPPGPRLPPPAPSAAQARSGPPPLPRAAATPPSPAALPKIPGMSESDLRALHQRYVDAQKQSGAAAGVKYETLVHSLAKQVPRVLEQPGVKGVRFDVGVQDGKPILKAIPQK
jgi:hypothetical protein